MFASIKFRDEFAFLDDGFATSVMSTGTTSGSAIALGGTSQLRKHIFIAQFASGTASTAVLTMYLASSTASAGTFISIAATSQVVSATGSGKYFAVLDTRNEYFSDLGTNALWVKVVLVVTTLALPVSLVTLGYLGGSTPASLYDAAALGVRVTEVDAF